MVHNLSSSCIKSNSAVLSLFEYQIYTPSSRTWTSNDNFMRINRTINRNRINSSIFKIEGCLIEIKKITQNSSCQHHSPWSSENAINTHVRERTLYNQTNISQSLWSYLWVWTYTYTQSHIHSSHMCNPIRDVPISDKQRRQFMTVFCLHKGHICAHL